MFPDLSLIMLSYKHQRTLTNTLTSYKVNGLLDLCPDLTIFFQKISDEDRAVADKFGLKYSGWDFNMRPFDYRIKQAIDTVQTKYFIFLESDWVLIENKEETEKQLLEALDLIESGKMDVVKFRHRRNPGWPLYSEGLLKFKEREVWDRWSSHLMECVHWYENPDQMFPDQIKKDWGYFHTTSEYINYTNNPCIYNIDLFRSKLSPFFQENQNIELRIEEGYWRSLGLRIAHGKGLFTHLRIG